MNCSAEIGQARAECRRFTASQRGIERRPARAKGTEGRRDPAIIQVGERPRLTVPRARSNSA